MTRKHFTLRPAGTAIAAVLALSSIPAAAQDATVTTTAPAPAPVIVLPSAEPRAAPVTTTTAPVAAPSAAAPAEPATTRSVTPRTVTRTTAARTAPAAAAQAAVAAPVANPAPVAPVEAVPTTEAKAPLPAPAAPASAVPAQTRTEGDNSLALAGLAGLLVLGGAGVYAATRRRRRVADDATWDEPVSYEPATYEPAVPTAAVAVDPIVAPAVVAPAVAASAAEPVDPTDRAAIIERMVDEPPSTENPFTSRKARYRRARLILQGREARGEPLWSEPERVDLNQHTPAFARTYEDA